MIGFGLHIARRRIFREFFDYPILKEDGFALLTEDGGKMLKEY